MITPSSSSSPGLPPAVSLGQRRPAGPAASPTAAESLSTTRHAQLQASLARSPEVRAEVVVHGVQLAADPSYPSRDVITHVAERLTGAPDGTDDTQA